MVVVLLLKSKLCKNELRKKEILYLHFICIKKLLNRFYQKKVYKLYTVQSSELWILLTNFNSNLPV